ncbi:HU family DNA-binding protein [Psittacicella hinzii]|uniref:Uncharacterized protein n=1 Tax=Psittacicella hinzii TaxID=2028575 RepID=A0A3A1YL68_9GAMM|nr:HU family DNA-binding protein [Psittacicella hinzii]RIY39033.1 hypothetical protein CKF58_02915 [Psittacicella hinzii]
MSKENLAIGELLTNSEFVDLLMEKLATASREELRTLTKTAAKEAYDLVVEALLAALLNGKKVRVKDLGTFTTKYRPSRTYRTPQDPKASVVSPETVTLHFTASTTFKRVVQENKALVEAHAKLDKKGKVAKKK